MATETEVSCKRCGSSLVYEDCEICPACGWYEEFDPGCPFCHGVGTCPVCLSSAEWCQANPLPGREDVARSTPEEHEYEVPGR